MNDITAKLHQPINVSDSNNTQQQRQGDSNTHTHTHRTKRRKQTCFFSKYRFLFWQQGAPQSASSARTRKHRHASLPTITSRAALRQPEVVVMVTQLQDSGGHGITGSRVKHIMMATANVKDYFLISCLVTVVDGSGETTQEVSLVT